MVVIATAEWCLNPTLRRTIIVAPRLMAGRMTGTRGACLTTTELKVHVDSADGDHWLIPGDRLDVLRRTM